MKIGDNVIPGSNNEIITLERINWCYKISSKATSSLYMDYRTFTIDLSENVPMWNMPIFANIYATSFDNSFGSESFNFFHGKPEIAQVLVNHHTSMSFKMRRKEVLKEKHPDCNEKTYWETVEEILYPRVKENCPYPCFNMPVPGDYLSVCLYDDSNGENLEKTDANRTCAKAEYLKLRNEGGFYNFKSCSIEEYEGRVLKDNDIIPGKKEFYYWTKSNKEDYEIALPEKDYSENPGNLSFMFSYTFESPQGLTVEVENYIVTFVDLIGIVGGTLGLFIGFAFYNNIIALVEYLIWIVSWAKRITRKSKAGKVSDVDRTSKKEKPKEETQKENPKQENTEEPQVQA